MSKDKQTQVWAELSLQGYLKSGSITMYLNDEELKEFKSMSVEQQEEYLQECGDFELDSYEIEWRTIEDIHIEEK